MKRANEIADAYDAGYLHATKQYHRIIEETKKRIEYLIERAAHRGEYEALVVARQILRGLK